MLVLLVGCWFYRGHIDAIDKKAAIEEMQNVELQSYVNYDTYVQGVREAANTQAQKDQYKYQSEVASLSAARAAAIAISDKLQHALTVYANSDFKGTGKDASCVSVQEADARARQLASVAGVLDAEGLQAARDAATCAVKLTACERWADTVEGMFK
jgi:hypothetical protein